jgi:hypothetical protein
MKAVFGWLSDPYVHVFAVGLVLVRLAMGVGGDEPGDMLSAPALRCQACVYAHQRGLPCPPVVVKTTAAPRAD